MNVLDSSIPLPPLPPGATEPPCLRGLEHKTPKAALRRLQVKRASWTAVLDEQDRQWAVGINYNDPDRIADIYSLHCSFSARRAREMGRRDAEEAKRVWEKRDKKKPPMNSYNYQDEQDTLYDVEISGADLAFASSRSRKPRTVQDMYLKSKQRFI